MQSAAARYHQEIRYQQAALALPTAQHGSTLTASKQAEHAIARVAIAIIANLKGSVKPPPRTTLVEDLDL